MTQAFNAFVTGVANATPPSGAELFPIIQGGASKNLTAAQMVAMNAPAAVSGTPAFNAPGSNVYPGAGSGLFNFTAQNTLHLRAGVARIRARNGTCKVLHIGDSTTGGYGSTGAADINARVGSYPTRLAQLLTARGLPAQSDNWFGDHNNQGGADYNVYNPAVTLTNFAPDNSYSCLGHWPFKATSTGANIAFTPTSTFDTIDVYYALNPNNSQFTVNVDGGTTLATLDGNGAVAMAKATVSCPLGTHTVNLTTTGPTFCFIHGTAVRNSVTPQIEHYNAGWDGATANDYNNASAPWAPLLELAQVQPDCTFINLTVNDILNTSTSIATYSANLQAIITAALVYGDVVLVIGAPCSGANWTSGSPSVATSYGNAVYALAASNNIPLLDLTTRLISYASANAVMPYFNSLHPGAAGYCDIASAFAAFFPL